MSPALRVHNLWKSYSAGVRGCSIRVWALRGCSFEIGVGERVAIVGGSGAGKTTLLRCIAGQRDADAGRIEAAHPVRLLDGDSELTAWGGERTLLMTSRDVAGVHGMVDRILLLTDGRLAPLTHIPVRRVAEHLARRLSVSVDPLPRGPLGCRDDPRRLPAPDH